MAALFVVSLATLVCCVVPASSAIEIRRVRSDSARAGSRAGNRAQLVENAGVRTTLCLAACGLLGLALWGLPGCVAGALAGAVVSWLLGRLEPPSVVASNERLARDLPVAVDLLAACSRAGLPLDRSLVVVGRAVGGPVEHQFTQIEARLRLGVDPKAEWRRLARHAHLAPLARTVTRSLESGAPVADGLERLASDQRREQRMRGQQRARSVGVKSAAPLAGCFLPAFMLVGVVPTVAGAFLRFVV